MGQNIKLKNNKPKLDQDKKGELKCYSEQYPWFSFRFLTTNNRYSLKYLENLGEHEKLHTLNGLLNKLKSMSENPWSYWLGLRKQTGIETISYERLNFKLSNKKLSKETSIYIIHFDTYQGNGKGRIIGFKDSPCSVMHIIGYDFDFSAYKHE